MAGLRRHVLDVDVFIGTFPADPEDRAVGQPDLHQHAKTGLVCGTAHIAVPALIDGEEVTVLAAPGLTADGRPAVPLRAACAWKVGAEGGLGLLALLDLAPRVRVVSGPDEISLGSPPLLWKARGAENALMASSSLLRSGSQN